MDLWRDRWLRGALAVALALRVLPFIVWGSEGCVRDECTYRTLAVGLTQGRGMEAREGWLWAPGWPSVLAVFHAVFGSVEPARALQVAASVGAVALLAAIVRRVDGWPAARVAAWLMALHPTLIWYARSLFSEVVYTALLLGAVWALLWARDGAARRAVGAGVLLGVCVLFRGVATYMAPIFALAAVWPAVGESIRQAITARWRHALALGLAAVVTVAPYSVSASRAHGGLVISDATLGQMMWLGNNDFPPMTFDWGHGQLESRTYDAWAAQGRRHCDKRLPAAQWDRCERDRGLAWIAANPREFVARMPLRVAQLVTPHTFLTRHVRSGRWPGMPWEVKEGLLAGVVATSFLVNVGGGMAAALRARGPFGVLAVGIVAYHVLAISLLAGLSRYRVPLEPFGLAFLGIAAVTIRQPTGAARWLLAFVYAGVVLAWMSATVWDGFPGAR